MRHWINFLAGFLIVATIGLAAPGTAFADNKPAQRMNDATSVLDQFVNIPEGSIPSALLNQAYGIAVIPSVLKIGFIGAFRRGHGVLAVRTADGHWSDPTFITLTGGSIGFQAGASSTDVILVFKTRRSVQRVATGQFTLGADAAVAAGPVGRSAAAATNTRLDASVYSYSRSRGIFAGVSLDGARIGIDHDANWQYYNQAGISAKTLLSRRGSNLPKSGQRFVYTLNQYMPPSNDQFHYPSNASGNANGASGGSDQKSTGQSSDQSSGSNELYGRTYSNSNAHSDIQVQQGADGSQTSDYSSGNAGQSSSPANSGQGG